MKPLTRTSNEVDPARLSSIPLDHLVDALPYFICAIDANGKFVFLNQTAEKILGYSGEELKEKSFFDLLVESDRQRFEKFFGFILGGTEISNFKIHFSRKDGNVLTLSWR
jgi:PAS domain S-box-containing protein